MPAPVVGNIDAAALDDLYFETTEILRGGGPSLKAHKKIHDAALKQVLSTQNPGRLVDLKDPDNKHRMRVYWGADCNSTAPTPCTDSCDVPDGDEIGLLYKDYDINQCIMGRSFSASENKWEDNKEGFQKYVPLQLAAVVKSILEELSARFIAHVSDVANSGVHQYVGTHTSASGGKILDIDPNFWNPEIATFIATSLEMNDLDDDGGINILDGGNLKPYLKRLEILTDKENASDAALLGALGDNIVSDIRKMPGIVGDTRTIAYHQDSLAVLTRTRFNKYGVEGRKVNANGKNQLWKTMDIPGYPGLQLDMVYQEKCVGGDIIHSWQPRVQFAVFQNPYGCSDNNTGVLQYRCLGSNS